MSALASINSYTQVSPETATLAASAPMQSSSLLAGKEFSWTTGTTIFAGIWLLLLVDAVSRFWSSSEKYYETPQKESAEKEWIVSASILGGTGANILHWADSEGMIALGEAGAALAQAFGYGSSAIISFFGSLDALVTLCNLDPEDEYFVERRNLALLELSSRVTTLFWAILGVASFIAGAAVLPGLSTGLFLISFLLFVGTIVYRGHLSRHGREPDIVLQPS